MAISHYCFISVSPFLPYATQSRDRVVGIATTTKGSGLSLGRIKNFLFSTSSRPALGPTQPPIERVPWGFFPGGKVVGA
jgi:hypothetical protein